MTAIHDRIETLGFSPDGRTVATVGLDRTIKLWDMRDPRRPRELSAFTGHTEKVFAAVFSPDGSTLATAGDDKAIKLWDVRDPRRPHEVSALSGHTNSVTWVEFSPDGHTLATAGMDKTTRLWETDVERVASRICEVAHPRMTRAEWDRYFPGMPFQPPCS
jgi:WD40 repeat protein